MSSPSFEPEFADVHSYASTHRQLTTTGKIILGAIGTSFVGMCALTIPFVLPAVRRICLPYVPATDRQVSNVMSLLKDCRKGRLVDIGSGDGRIVIEAAKHGFQAVGVELNPWLVLYSRIRALRLRSSQPSLPKFILQDLWKHDISGYDCIVVFGVDSMMEKLSMKLVREMSEDCSVIACRFPLPCDSSAVVGDGIDTVWLYRRPNLLHRLSTVSSNS